MNCNSKTPHSMSFTDILDEYFELKSKGSVGIIDDWRTQDECRRDNKRLSELTLELNLRNPRRK